MKVRVPSAFRFRNKTRPDRLRLESLEERVVFNAVDPASPALERLIIRESTETSGPDQLDAWAIPAIFNPAGSGPRDPEGAPPYPGQTFTLHSRPSSPRKIFLDFDGHITSGTSWNTSFNGGASFTTGAMNFEGSGSTFTTNEEERLQKIWQRVMEDFSPFDVDVTTEDPGVSGLTFSGGSDTTWGIRVVITPTDGWISDNVGSVGGIAYVPSFKSSNDITAYVFSGNLGPNDEKLIAEAISHEVGHTLGLSHDGTSTQGYYGGHNGSGTPGWAPIMGVGYYQELAQWSRGEYPGANNTQDDLSIITNTTQNFGYRPDDAGNTIATATAATVVNTSLTFSGVIERTNDIDVLSFPTGTGNVTFTFSPWINSPNLDIRAELRNSAGTILAFSDPLNVLNASISTTIATAGTYYLFVEGIGVGNASTTGYSDYGSLGQYTVSGTVISVSRLNSIESSSLNFVENQAPLTLTSSLAVSTGSNLIQATVSVGNYANGQDTLLFTNQGGITGSFNAGSGTLTLSGNATAAAYQTALRSITYANASNNPSAATRTFTFQLTDASSNPTNTLVRDMTLTTVNDQPLLNSISDQNYDEDSSSQVVSLAGIATGGNEVQSLTVSAVSNNPGLIPDPTVTYNSPSGSGSIALFPVVDYAGSAVITVTVTDNGGTANGGVNSFSRQFTVVVNPINDAPTFVLGPDPYSPLIGGNQTLTNWASNVSAGGPDESGQTFGFTVTNDNNSLFETQPSISDTGTLSFTPVAGVSGIVNVDVYATDNGGTANGGSDTSSIQSFAIHVGINRAPTIDNSGDPLLKPVAQSSVNPESNSIASFALTHIADLDPGSPLGIAITAADFSRGQWEYSIDDGLTWDALLGVSSSSARLLRIQDLIRYLPTSGQIGTATFSYHSWDQSSGTPGGTADLGTGTGGGTAFSLAEETAILRVAAAVTTIAEDGKSAGKQLAVLPASTFSDPDVKPKRGIAVIGAGGQIDGTWQYSVKGKGWKAFSSFDPSAATLLRSNDKVRFVPAANAFGEAYLVYRAWDQSAGTPGTTIDLTALNSVGGSTAFSDGTDFMFAVVKEVNDKPVLDKKATISLTPVDTSDNDPTGNSVADILKSLVTDQDAGTIPGLAVTGFSKVGGTWQYQLDGASGWTNVPLVSSASSLLLSQSDRLRFLPDGATEGVATISFKAWDQSTGVPGALVKSNTSAFSKKIGTGLLKVSSTGATPPNAAPILDDAPNVVLRTIDEDSKPAGDSVATLLAGMTDADAGALQGVAVTNLSGTSTGVWQYSKDGRVWKPILAASDEVALLLADTDWIRYLPNLNQYGTATLSFHAWDRTQGTPGQYANLALAGNTGGTSAFSTVSDIALLNVNSVNDSPVLNLLPKPTLTTIAPGSTNPVGTSVSKLLGTALSDVEAGDLQGIAISKIPVSPGEWQFQLAGDSGWTALAGSGDGQAMLLRTTDFIRFLPLPQFAGIATIQYRGWDRTSGTAGTFASTDENTSLSKATETATAIVGTANFRPTLDTKPLVSLPPVPLNATDPAGYTVASLLGTSVIDADNNALSGIAVTGVDLKNGIWEYSIDGGQWLTLNAFTGVSVLLKSTDKVRFIPNTGFAGSATIKYKAWDQTEGGAGDFLPPTTSAFSKATETATVAVNTAPTLTW